MRQLSDVIGGNAKTIRLKAHISMDEFARVAKGFGLKWSSSRVGDFEAGRVSPTLPTMYAVAAALSTVSAKPVRLADLLAGRELVEISPKLHLPAEMVAKALAGAPIDIAPGLKDRQDANYERSIVLGRFKRYLTADQDFDEFAEAMVTDYQQAGLAERRAASDLNVELEDVVYWSRKLWGRSLSQERDIRAGVESNAQRRGQVSRDLKSELKDGMGSDGDH